MVVHVCVYMVVHVYECVYMVIHVYECAYMVVHVCAGLKNDVSSMPFAFAK